MKIDQGQKMFAGSVASALVRAWTERLGLRVVVDPRGGTSSAELTDDTGRVVWSQKAEGIQLELPLAPAAPRPLVLWPHDRETLTPAAERKKAKRERSSPKASAPKKAASKGKRKRP